MIRALNIAIFFTGVFIRSKYFGSGPFISCLQIFELLLIGTMMYDTLEVFSIFDNSSSVAVCELKTLHPASIPYSCL